MRFAAVGLVVFLLSFESPAQPLPSELTTTFAFQVNSIDDFVDRFNFRKNTGFLNFIKKNYPDYQMTRPKMVASLFNTSNKALMNQDAFGFVNQVTDSVHPAYLSYRDKNWYAELRCRVSFKGQPQTLTLIVKVEGEPKTGYCWALVSAKAEFLKMIPGQDDSLVARWQKLKNNEFAEAAGRYSLSPVSHGLDFITVADVFENRMHARDYLSREFHSARLEKLALLIRKSYITFGQVNSISYHFLQIDGWILQADFVKRQDKNGGWRINRLMQATGEQKSQYLKNQLGIQ